MAGSERERKRRACRRFGGWLIITGVSNSSTGRPFSGGDVIMVFFSVAMASFQIGQARARDPLTARRSLGVGGLRTYGLRFRPPHMNQKASPV